MIISSLIKARYDWLLVLCKAHKVKRLYAFVSSVAGGFDASKSDIDLQVEIDEKDPVEKGDLLLYFFMEMEKLFNRKIDLLFDQPIENPYLKASVDRSKALMYDGETEKILA